MAVRERILGTFLCSITLIVIAQGCFTSVWAAVNSQFFTYQGRLLNDVGTAPLSGNVALTLGIYDMSGNCLLYEEQQAVDLTGTGGAFQVQVGQLEAIGGKRTVNDPHNAMAVVFANDAAISAQVSGSCPGGSYTPVAGASRKLRVTVTPQAGSPVTLTPDQVIGAAPQASVAETLQGLSPSDLDARYALKDQAVNFTSLTVAGETVSTTTYADSKLGGSTLDVTGRADGHSIKWDAALNKWVSYAPVMLGTSGGSAVDIGTIPSCAANEKLQMSPGPIYTWSCVTGAIGATGPTGQAGAQGPQGIQGPQGAQGTQGTTGPTGASPWLLNGSASYYTAGNVGIGITNPSTTLDVNGPIKVGTGATNGVACSVVGAIARDASGDLYLCK